MFQRASYLVYDVKLATKRERLLYFVQILKIKDNGKVFSSSVHLHVKLIFITNNDNSGVITKNSSPQRADWDVV